MQLQSQQNQPPHSQHPQMTLATDSINENGMFDPRYTCDLDNSSPELHWDHFPENTAGFALTVEDRDSPNKNFTQWLIYNIPSNITHLPAGIPP
ncbi:MAG: YbhB/YbcL family Raf kinase inhibitor-like protein, partial [Bdellovibrionia bacterium]